MEKEIIGRVRQYFGDNLVSLLVEGGYAAYDYMEGYSDYDLLILVKEDRQVQKFDLDDLSKKYSVDIQCDVKLYEDLINRIKNNNKARRYIDNLELVKIKNVDRFLAGKDVRKLIPKTRALIARDVGFELRSAYLYATNPDQRWNIFIREPRKWCNYIINMADGLLLSKGIVVKKDKIPEKLERYFPAFKGIKYVRKALRLRRTKKVLALNKNEKNQFKIDLRRFLDAYHDLIF